MGAAGALPPWRCGSTAAVAPDTGSELTGTEGTTNAFEAGRGVATELSAVATFGPAWTSMICDAVVLGLAWTTVVAVGGLAEAGLASLGCPSSESGERARLLASPSSEGVVATGCTMTAERMALPESSAESALGDTALRRSDPVERPIGTAPSLLVLLVHAFTGSDEAGAEPIGLATALFAGVVSEDTSAVSDGAGAGLVDLSVLTAACS